MSVIGRLDDQVEAVLINPLRRRERSDDEAERDAPHAPTHAPRHEEREAESPGEAREAVDTLPVWLL